MYIGAYRTAIKTDLTLTSELSDAQLDRAVQRAVDDLSRLVPREKALEFTIYPTITDELFYINDTWVNLTYKPIKYMSEVVTSEDGSTTYTRDTDYELDYTNGRIRSKSGGSLAFPYTFPIDFGALEADYTKSELALDLSAYKDDIFKVTRVEYPLGISQPRKQLSGEYVDGVLYLALGPNESKLQEYKHIVVYYYTLHTIPTTSAYGSYTRMLDEVVLKGAGAYSLFILAGSYQRQAATDLTSARSSIAATASIRTSITTLRSSIATVHTAAVTAMNNIGTQVGLISTPLASIVTALAKVDTHAAAAGSAKTALDSAVTEIAKVTTDITTADGSRAAITTALGKIDTLLLGVADSVKADLTAALATPLTAAATALNAVATLLTGVADSAKADLTAALATPLTDTATALAALITRLAAAETEMSTAYTFFEANLKQHIITTAGTPNAEDMFELGDNYLNVVTVGEQVALTYARYAELALAMADRYKYKLDLYAQNIQSRIQAARSNAEEAQGRLGISSVYLQSALARVQSAKTFVEEAQGRLLIASRYIDSATVRLQSAGAFVGEAQQRLGYYDTYIKDATARVAQVQQYVQLAEQRLAISGAFIAEARGHADRINAYLGAADKYTQEAQQRNTQLVQYLTEFAQLNQMIQDYLSEADRYHNSAQHYRELAESLRLEAQGKYTDYLNMLSGSPKFAAISSTITSSQQK